MQQNDHIIPVTKPFLPPKPEYDRFLQGIWDRGWLTNNGPLVKSLEAALGEFLDFPNILYVNNGTIALQIAIKALDLKGEIITTPFSYVATTSSIVWENCTPVMVDIDADTLNIDPTKIEAAITPATSAILATHVYGNPCNIDAIERIATQNGLKVIYDAAHCFGTKYKGKTVFAYGDISTTSFHATKLFHTVEGGAVFSNDAGLLHKMSYLRNFGHRGAEAFQGLGINGKNSELHAAMGMANLPYLDKILDSRKQQAQWYLSKLNNPGLTFQTIEEHTEYNHAYFPVLFASEQFCIGAKAALEEKGILARRYFYPSLSELPYISGAVVPVCEALASRVLCLPMYFDLTSKEVDLVCKTLISYLNSAGAIPEPAAFMQVDQNPVPIQQA